jgi:hypothetical protein
MSKKESGRNNAEDVIITGEQTEGRQEAGPSALGGTGKGKPNPKCGGDCAVGPNLTKEQKAAWRKKTKRKMKKAPRTTVREELPEVLVSLVEVARGGSCPHAKILMEFADAENIPDAKEQKKSQTLAELLLERLG